MRPARFRKRPVTVSALHLDGANAAQVAAWIRRGGGMVTVEDNLDGEPVLVIATLEGPIFARTGDWVIRGIAGEFYPCKPDIFADTYEQVCSACDGHGALPGEAPPGAGVDCVPVPCHHCETRGIV